MTVKRKLLLAGVVVGAAVTYLAYAGLKQGWVHYVPVDQFVSDVTQQKNRVRLMGSVSGEGLFIAPARNEARFLVMGTTGKVNVRYRGSIPDMFQSGANVVVEGKLDGGVFNADVLLTKCASKYDEKHPGNAKQEN